MGRKIKLGAWETIARHERARVGRLGAVTGIVMAVNDNSGGWIVHAHVGGVISRAYVPGVVSWREAERCATRYLRRLITASRAGVSA